MDVKTVRKNDFSHPAMDFFGLRNSAIEYLQQLAGEEWTDFNEHDPGVTILDQLCYAITDLSYRTNYDIADLLAGKPEYCGKKSGQENPLRPTYQDTFYTLDEVMPCHPLTVTDWRKLIIDRVENVRNAWIEPLKHDYRHPIGIYRILIEAVKEEDGEKSMDKLRKAPGEDHQKVVEAYHAQLRQEVSRVFHDNRNLCEDLESVQILKERDVQIKASIEIDDQGVSEKILAEIYFTIEQYLSHPIRRYPLNQMLEKGHTIGTIFNGPRLKNGFILDEELYPLVKHIHYAGLIRAILDIPEVKNIHDFRIKGADDDKKVFELRELEVPVFNMKSSQSDSQYKIVLSKNSNVVYIDEPLVNSHYEAFKLSQPKPFIPRQHEQSLRAFDVKLGRDRKVGEYRSMQYNFPPVYGIGEFGVDADMFVSEEIPGKKRSARRIGLAQQLKGYLLIFDQVLANYLEQLASVPILFSINADIDRTYFPAMKMDVPRLEPLLKQKEQGRAEELSMQQPDQHQHHIGDDEVKIMQEANLMFSSKLDYRGALKLIVKTNDRFYERRNRFLDHLLARFGVSMPSSMFVDANWYFTTEKELHEFILATKTAALQYVTMITENRGQAPVLHSPLLIPAWLECYIQLRLGIVNSKMELRMQFFKLAAPLYAFKIVESMQQPKRKKHEMLTSEEGESDKFQSYDQPEEASDHSKFRNLAFYRQVINQDVHIDIDMLRNGYLANNYRFDYTGDKSKKITVIYRDPENIAGKKRSWNVVGIYNDVEAAITGILNISSFIRYLNLETEGLHIVEHLPLRPPIDKLKFETQLIDESGNVLAQSDGAFSCKDDCDQVVRKFLSIVNKKDSGEIIHDEKLKWYSVVFRDEQHKIIARSPKQFNNRNEAKILIEQIRQRCRNLNVKNYKRDVDFRFRTLYNSTEIPSLSFYSLSATAVMPAWTSRFSNPGFRKTISQLLRNYAPAHVNIGEFWLEPSEMHAFEVLYEKWRKAWAKDDKETNTIAIQLSMLLNKYYEEINC